MFPVDYLIAAALLTAPPCAEDLPGAAAVYARLAPTINHLSVAWEILDPHEVRFMLSRADDFRSDITLLRQRNQDLRDAPPLHDAVRFPPRQVVSELLAFNRSYREHLEKCHVAGTTPTEDYTQAVQEVDRLHQVWDAIRDSRCDYCYVNVRRQALKRVRDLIGETAFYSGAYPPHVPVWRFQRID